MNIFEVIYERTLGKSPLISGITIYPLILIIGVSISMEGFVQLIFAAAIGAFFGFSTRVFFIKRSEKREENVDLIYLVLRIQYWHKFLHMIKGVHNKHGKVAHTDDMIREEFSTTDLIKKYKFVLNFKSNKALIFYHHLYKFRMILNFLSDAIINGDLDNSSSSEQFDKIFDNFEVTTDKFEHNMTELFDYYGTKEEFVKMLRSPKVIEEKD